MKILFLYQASNTISTSDIFMTLTCILDLSNSTPLPSPNFTCLTNADALVEVLWQYVARQRKVLNVALEKLGKNSKNSSTPSLQESLLNKANHNKESLNLYSPRLASGRFICKQEKRRKPSAQKGDIGYGRELLLSNECAIIIACKVPTHCRCGCVLDKDEVKHRKQVFGISENQIGEKLLQAQYRVFNNYDVFALIEHLGDIKIKQSIFSNVKDSHRILLKHFKRLWQFIHYVYSNWRNLWNLILLFINTGKAVGFHNLNQKNIFLSIGSKLAFYIF